jgi:D-arabinose 1-dehydrogenase-like Zn-dependent alcohol dehydrogenase
VTQTLPLEERKVRAIVKSIPVVGFDYRDDVPDAELGTRQVRIEVAAASICGTDRELVNYTAAAQAFGLRLPVTLGHEVAGTVLETGSAVTAASRRLTAEASTSASSAAVRLEHSRA